MVWICLLGLRAVEWPHVAMSSAAHDSCVWWGHRSLCSGWQWFLVVVGVCRVLNRLDSGFNLLLANGFLDEVMVPRCRGSEFDFWRRIVYGVSWGPCARTLLVRPVRWPARWLGLLLLGWSCRIGEAAVPGPANEGYDVAGGNDEVTFQIGVCNVNGLADKAHYFADLQEDLWCVSETHLSLSGKRTFGRMMKRQAGHYPFMVFGHDVLPRSVVSDIGRWSGVGTVSRWPTHRLPHDWEPLLHSTGRINVSTSFIFGRWISGCVVYGTPVGPTHDNARQKTNGLIHAAVARVLQLSGPRYVGGDFNHDHDCLESVELLRKVGFVDVQDLNMMHHGIPPVATCRGKTRRDFLFVSPELACLFASCRVTEWDWTDHSALVGVFRCTALDLERFPWPRPDPIDWKQFASRDPGLVVSFVSSPDVSETYAAFWTQAEQTVRSMAKGQGKPLPARCFGRGQRTKPERTSFQVTPLRAGRSGDVRPSFLGFSHVHRQWFRQLRRLESYCRLVRHGIHTWDMMEHRAHLWTSILRANGFRMDFATWWTSEGHENFWKCCVPSFPPLFDLAHCLFEAFRGVVHDFENHLKGQQRYKAKIGKAYGIGSLYKEVRRDPPDPVNLLVRSVVTQVSCVDRDTQALEFSGESPWTDSHPIRHKGRSIQPIVATPDKVWCDDVEGVEAGDVVAQTQCTGKLADIFVAFHDQWRVRWLKHPRVEPSQWQQILDFADLTLRPVNSVSPKLSVVDLRMLIRMKSRRSACGLDGVSVQDLQGMDSNQLLSLLSLYSRAETDGAWPAQCTAGSVQCLAKKPEPEHPGDFRPVTVLSLVYRLWSSLHSRHWLKVLSPSLDDDLCGNRPGHCPADVWRVILQEVSEAHASNSLACGFVVDLVKAYNTLPRYPVLYASKKLGIGQETLIGWSGALAQICRHFAARNSYSDGLLSTTGLPEGCGLSCVGMLVLDLLLHRWMKALHPSIRTLTFVDNWEILVKDEAWLEGAFGRLQTFVDLLDLELDLHKTFYWSTSKEHRARLRLNGCPVKLASKDLGAHVAYTKQLCNQYLTPRILSLDSFWERLFQANGSHSQKVRVVLTAAWPRAFHACSSAILGRRFMDVIRTKCMRALKLLKPGSSSWLQFACEQDGLDPSLFVIWSTIRDFRAHRSACLPAPATPGLEDANCPFVPGSVQEILVQRLHRLGWQVVDEHRVSDAFGSFDLRELPLQELSFRVQWAWTEVVAQQVSHRDSLRGFNKVDRLLTRQGLMDFGNYEQGVLRRHLNGSTLTNQTACYWSESGSAACLFCGEPDSVYHRLWQCSASETLRSELPDLVVRHVEQFPQVLSVHGWTLASPFWFQWISALLSLPATVPPSLSVLPVGSIVDFFTDGSCLWQDQPRYRLASWSVIWSPPLSFQPGFEGCRILAAEPLAGLVQTSYRGELMALRAACHFAAEAGLLARVWCDCQSVLSRFRALTQGTRILQPNSPHSDLWNGILESVQRNCNGRIEVIKVPAHQSIEEAQDAFDCWVTIGNAAADEAARQANAGRSQEFWCLWENHMRAVERNQQIGHWVRKHLVQVATLWTQAVAINGVESEVVVERRKILPPKVWPTSNNLVVPQGSFTRLFGDRFQQVVVQWFNSIWDDRQVVEWVSFAHLYILFQLQCGESGVARLSNKWVVLSEVTGATPEQYRFASLCKWFRLMLQALFKAGGLRVHTCTTRPMSQLLQCHVGRMPCSSIEAGIPPKGGRLAW